MEPTQLRTPHTLTYFFGKLDLLVKENYKLLVDTRSDNPLERMNSKIVTMDVRWYISSLEERYPEKIEIRFPTDDTLKVDEDGLVTYWDRPIRITLHSYVFDEVDTDLLIVNATFNN